MIRGGRGERNVQTTFNRNCEGRGKRRDIVLRGGGHTCRVNYHSHVDGLQEIKLVYEAPIFV